MGREVVVIPAADIEEKNEKQKKKLRVAAYCRVSTDEERQLGSFENQIDYFTKLIEEERKYEMVKIYSDEGISGCSIRSRKGFREMIEDCEAGKIDLVITKSISRFARNTQDSLKYTRKLKDLGIGVYFEKEGLNTLESSGELLLTLFSCFAQEESRSISENTAWGIRSKFQQGIAHLNTSVLLGYDKDGDGKMVIDEAQAGTVRRIYRMYLEGFSQSMIAKTLNREDVPGVHGEARWCAETIGRILENEKYKGALLMQKTITVSYLTKQHVKNTGQLNQYYIENDHPAIIPPEEWEAVQEEIARRREFRKRHGLRGLSCSGASPFYAHIFCEGRGPSGSELAGTRRSRGLSSPSIGKCGEKLQRIYHQGVSSPYWYCKSCGARIEERQLRAAFCEAFNTVVENREEYLPLWEEMRRRGTPLEKTRAEQMEQITEKGTIRYEVPELTRAILQEIWLTEEGVLKIRFLSGNEIVMEGS